MRHRPLLFWGILFLAVASASGQGASSGTPRQDTIVLPLELVAGQPATLAVLTSEGRVAPGVRVVLSSGQIVTTDESGRAHFLAPREAGISLERIPGTEIREAADILPQESGNTDLRIFGTPVLASRKDHFAVSGSGFQGDADRNRVEVGEKNAFVLASSSLELIVMPPTSAATGPARLAVFEGTAEATTQITLVDIETSTLVSAAVLRGRKSKVSLHVRGTTEPVQLEVENLSSQTIEFPHGDAARLRTSGGPDNSAIVPVKGVTAGQFSFAVYLENTPTKANLPIAGDFLEAAQKTAPRDVRRALQQILKELRGNSNAVEKAQQDLRVISGQSRSADFQTLIHCARRALSGE